jgi:hypothetical protein
MTNTQSFFSRSAFALMSGALVLGIAAWSGGSALAANPASDTTTTNQSLNVDLTVNAPGNPVWLGTPVTADAKATLGAGEFANIAFVVDISGSMENSGFNPFQPAVGDCDGDGIVGTTLDSACVGLISLNSSFGSASNVNVSLVAFADGAKTADMNPAAGLQTFTTPPDADNNSNTINDVEEVVRSLTTEFGAPASAGIGLFTADVSAGFAFATNYNAALTNMNAAFASQPAGGTDIAFFLSDGTPDVFTTGAGSPLQDAVNAGTVIHTYAMGSIAPGSCAAGQPLFVIADETGGTCTEVNDPSTLNTVLPVALTNIVSLEIAVNGSSVCNVVGSEPVSMALAGCNITGDLAVGMNLIEATATAADGTVVTADQTLGVIDLDLTPATDQNDLGAGDDTHAVTATILGDPTQVAGHTITFAVGGQNAGAAGVCSVNADCTTDAAGQVTFTYSVPVVPASIGLDTISASATVSGSIEVREVEKEWIDATPPEASCTESVNPHGKTVPRAGQKSPGQNEDGFYQLSAMDLLDPNPQVFVVDTGSGTVFGGFASGITIKYTQAPGGTPSQETMGGPSSAVSWHIKGTGDMEVYAVDGSGNESDHVSCLVPPPPK